MTDISEKIRYFDGIMLIVWGISLALASINLFSSASPIYDLLITTQIISGVIATILTFGLAIYEPMFEKEYQIIFPSSLLSLWMFIGGINAFTMIKFPMFTFTTLSIVMAISGGYIIMETYGKR